ncbi:hypothetical protein BRADI_1g37794v3, partial [Brachypodium distachyon]
MASSSTFVAAGKACEGLEKALGELVLREGELDDVVIEEAEVEKMALETRWLALARVHTSRPFSVMAFEEKMRRIWSLAQEAVIREAGDNLFLVKFSCLGDWKKVMYQGPWLFQLYQSQAVVDQLARRIGKVISMEMNPPKYYEGDYVLVRTSIDVREPLIRVVPLKLPKERLLLDVRYEKLGFFCDVCGLFGHNKDECRDGVHEDGKLQYGKWLLATRRVAPTTFSYGPRAPSAGRGGWGGCGGGRGREMSSLKQSSQEADLGIPEELDDTATSPVKTMDASIDGKDPMSARKKLDMDIDSSNGQNPSVGSGA